MHLAAVQHGAIGRGQLLEAGLSSAAVGRLVSSGRLRPLWRGVYVVGGHPTTMLSQLMGATLLGSRPCVSHRSAAFLWRLYDETPPIEVSSKCSLNISGITSHRKTVEKGDLTQVSGIAATSPHRTLIDLGDVVAADVVEDALDRALERRITSAAWLERELERIGTRGKKGAATLRSLLSAGDEKPPTWLERRFLRLLKRADLPGFVREHPSDRYRIDFAWPEVLLGVEVHGAKWHKKRLRWAKDLERHNCLTAMGWTLLHFTWEQIGSNPGEVISEIVMTYRRLRGWQSFSR